MYKLLLLLSIFGFTGIIHAADDGTTGNTGVADIGSSAVIDDQENDTTDVATADDDADVDSGTENGADDVEGSDTASPEGDDVDVDSVVDPEAVAPEVDDVDEDSGDDSGTIVAG